MSNLKFAFRASIGREASRPSCGRRRRRPSAIISDFVAFSSFDYCCTAHWFLGAQVSGCGWLSRFQL